MASLGKQKNIETQRKVRIKTAENARKKSKRQVRLVTSLRQVYIPHIKRINRSEVRIILCTCLYVYPIYAYLEAGLRIRIRILERYRIRIRLEHPDSNPFRIVLIVKIENSRNIY